MTETTPLPAGPRRWWRAIPTLLAALLACVMVPVPAANASTVVPVPDILDSVGGNVYVGQNPDWTNSDYWDGTRWVSMRTLLPASPATQDGPSVQIPGGWWIYWSAQTWGGSFMVWRYPQNGQMTYAGTEYPGFKIRLKQIGYTDDGQVIDSVIDFTRVMAWQQDGLPEPAWFTPFEISTVYGPLAAAEGNGVDRGIAVDMTFNTRLVKTGTDTLIDASHRMDVLYWDIDQPLHFAPGGAPTMDFSSSYREGIKLANGYEDVVKIGQGTQLRHEEDVWFRSGATDNSSTPSNLSSIVATAGPEYTTQWRGEGCSTGIGYDSKVVQYPQWSAPTKNPPLQYKKRGEVAAFEIQQTFPFVADSNKPGSIVLSDELDPALVASRASVKVTKTMPDGSPRDVTDNWTIAVDGQTITATAKDTSHGCLPGENPKTCTNRPNSPEGAHVFTINAPVSTTTDLSTYARADEGQTRYVQFPNTASVTVDDQVKQTDTVHVKLPHEAKGQLELTAKKTVTGAALKGNQFKFVARERESGRVVTASNRADGTVVFPKFDFTQDDIGKTFTYDITEVIPRPVPNGWRYDTHTDTMTVEVSDAGEGQLAFTRTTDVDGVAFENVLTSAFAVKKVNSTDNSVLPGAGFTLYADDGDGTFDEGDAPAQAWSDAALTAPIPGGTATTEAQGVAYFRGLLPGKTYWLKETRAPAGFTLDVNAHRIDVSAKGEVTTVNSAGTVAALPVLNGVATITIGNDPLPVMPSTAGPGVVGMVFAGSFLTALGAGVFLIRRSPTGRRR
ncbi:SpaA isopeptide-forming pilin-related protein [Schaalia sp. 19OD2882]|uniref:SpaA isopeptide-forming pilin-related protein n=1 Tax=Schaalia sp. 19OD2882 TaxID=2794089 RepID=UPI0020A76AD0|nr:SpaA isopeptide-forming pilin-related protein [Schaalia sp. 19OD2882]